MTSRSTFTGRDRLRRTRWTVRVVDVVARLVITVGGVGTIVAVSLVALSLLAVTAPLFSSPELAGPERSPAAWNDVNLVRFEVDEYRVLGWAVLRDGSLRQFHVRDGSLIDTQPLSGSDRPTCVAAFPEQNLIALGTEAGAVHLFQVRFQTTYIESEELPESLQKLVPGSSVVWEGAVVERTSQGALRRQTIVVEPRPPLEVAQSPIHSIDVLSSVPILAVQLADGTSRLVELREKTSLLSDETSWVVDAVHVLPAAEGRQGPAEFLLMTGRGDSLYRGWKDGTVVRYDTRRPAEARVAESRSVVSSEGAELTAFAPLLGRMTILVGDSAGGLAGWFVVRRTEDDGAEREEFVRAKPLPTASSAVTSLASSRRSRVAAAGYADGSVRLFQVTTEELLAEVRTGTGKPVNGVTIATKEDGLFADSSEGLDQWTLDLKYPEATLKALFGKVWYEGYPEPEHVWQSTHGSVDSEAKFGMVPLIFGTVKATFYAMLFAVPLALCAAIYTSEFLDRGTRSRVKPMIETMASLPSVVLGFLAAFAVAPFVESRVTTVLCSMATLPVLMMLGAYVWQLCPASIRVRYPNLRILAVVLLIPAALLAAWVMGPLLERWLFSGDLMRWLDGRRTRETFGSAFGGWAVLALPLSAIATGLVFVTFVSPSLVRKFGRGDRTRFAAIDLGKFGAGVALTLVLDAVLAGILTAAGFDPRGTFVGTYSQRNALVVGFIMGFAVIPIIYTIADDALTSVPEQLRSASLGSGATPWQTAVRIVIPTAMSGLFSAIMIGLGRAVGETMIVLMAAGNTPLREWNPFSGFRTLSANIAVELPEATLGGTHYRILFFAGLTLFVLTFAVNTMAEFVRMRFRRRMYQL